MIPPKPIKISNVNIKWLGQSDTNSLCCKECNFTSTVFRVCIDCRPDSYCTNKILHPCTSKFLSDLTCPPILLLPTPILILNPLQPSLSLLQLPVSERLAQAPKSSSSSQVHLPIPESQKSFSVKFTSSDRSEANQETVEIENDVVVAGLC